jgi:hypothetical protein
MVFCFVQKFFFRTTQDLEYYFFLSRESQIFFPEFKNDVIHGATIRIVIRICTVSIIQSSLLAKDILSQVGVKSRWCQSLALIS